MQLNVKTVTKYLENKHKCEFISIYLLVMYINIR